MIRQEDLPQQVPFEGQEETLEVTQEAGEEDFTREGVTTITTTMEEDQTSWWETLQKYSEEYERKLSLSLLFGGSTQALTEKTLPSQTRIKRASYSSRTFKGM